MEIEVTAIVWMLLAGVGIAAVYLWYNRRFLGVFVRKLSELDATSADTAVTMEELHLKPTPMLKAALREDGALYDAIGQLESNGTRYYILPKKHDMLKAKFRNESTGFASVLLILCLLAAAGVVFTLLYPYISDFASSLLNSD